MASRYPTHSSRGRELKPSRKLKERLRDQVAGEFDVLMSNLTTYSQDLMRCIDQGTDEITLGEIYDQWLRFHEDMLEAEAELRRYLAPDEGTVHDSAFKEDLRYFLLIKEKVDRHLEECRDESRSIKSEPDTVYAETDKLQQQIRNMEEEISRTREQMELTRIQERIFSEQFRGPGRLNAPASSTPKMTPSKHQESYLHQAENPMAYRGQYYQQLHQDHREQGGFVPWAPSHDRVRRLATEEQDQVPTYPRAGNDQVVSRDDREQSWPYMNQGERDRQHYDRHRYQDQDGREYDRERPRLTRRREPDLGTLPADPTVSVLNKLADILQEKKSSRLPSMEPEIFEGDFVKFPAWISSFEALIEKRFKSSGERMFYLQKYTGGEARELLTGFEDFQAEDAYANAKVLLMTRYGDKIRIAESYKSKLAAWPFIKPGERQSLQKYSDYLWKCYKAMSSIGHLSSLNSPEENRKMVKKLPFYIVDRWQRVIDLWVYERPPDMSQFHLPQSREYPPFIEFCKFVSNEARVANGPCSVTDQGGSPVVEKTKSTTSPKKQFKKTGPTATTLLTSTDEKSPEKREAVAEGKGGYRGRNSDDKKPPIPRCWFCEEEHWLSTCKKFLESEHEKKVTFVKEKGICFGCLRKGHIFKECKIRRPELMRDPKAEVKKTPEKSADKKTDEVRTMLTRSAGSGGFSTHILPLWLSSVDSPEKEILIYGVVDSQSDSCFLTPAAVEKLGVEETKVDIKLVTMGKAMVVSSGIVSGLQVRGWNEQKKIEIPKCYTRDLIPANKTTIPDPEDVKKWKHLVDVADKLMKPRDDVNIELMISFKCSAAFISEECIYGDVYDPFGKKTPLGWTVMGKLKDEDEDDDHRCFITSTREITTVDMKRIFDQGFEAPARDVNMSQEDRRFLDVVSSSINQREDKHMELDLPLKTEDMKLPNNRTVAEKRLTGLKKRLLTDEVYSERYRTFINDMIDKGQAEIVGDDEPVIEGRVWYLPHMGVYHPRKPQKLRVVFDASARFKEVSLNESLLSGPDQTNNLLGVIMRFRSERVALTCDVEGMFHQVYVSKMFRDLFRFLWYRDGNPNGEIQEMRVAVNVFGASSSPGCANFAFKEVARRLGEEYGELTVEFILRHFYVDDGIITVEEAVDLAFSSHGLCAEGGFRLHKFSSNSQEVLSLLPDELKSADAKEWQLSEENVPVEITLGIAWCKLRDCFIFVVKLLIKPATRRGMLSSLSSLYDPIGMVSPVILKGRIILKELCSKKFDWDEKVPVEVEEMWNDWYQQLAALSDLEIPRCVKEDVQNIGSVQIHVFCDASNSGYGVCGYLRLEDEDGRVAVNLLMAKSRVTPSKVTTIPRLELQAAVLAVKIGRFLEEELTYDDVKIYYWSDSCVTLGYIRNSSKRFHLYVSNRVASIRENSNPEDWNYVPTDLNPADAASRGLTAEEILRTREWWKGPEFLSQPVEEFLITEREYVVEESDPEVKREKVCLATEVMQNDIMTRLETVSTWRRMRRVVAVWQRYMKILKEKTKERKGLKIDVEPLTVAELKFAENWIYRLLQKTAFEDVYYLMYATKNYPETRKAIKSRNAVLRRYTNLYKLDVYMDDDELLHVGGRIRRSGLTNEMKHPILLPKNNVMVTRLIRYHHRRRAHAGRGNTLTSLRTAGIWIVNGRAQVDKALRKCVTCRRLRGNLLGQRMADLPRCRLEQSPPFTKSGMDVFGPFEIKVARSMKKRWIVVFVCMVMRAVHLEVLHTMDTSSLINALRRLMARRGEVKEVFCDRGSNFIGSKSEFEKAKKEVNVDDLKKIMADEGCQVLQFNFNFPKSSHMGGSWERMIRTIRSVLSRLLSQHGGRLDDESLVTMVTEAEAIVNSRPITYASMTDVDDPVPITPMQLLTLKSQVVMPPAGIFVKEDLYCARRWRQVQYLADLFWKQWIKEYIPSLQERRKWVAPKENLEEDDVVLISDDQVRRCDWMMGKVIRVEPGDDELVRKVVLKTQTGTLDRPVHKLVFLYRPGDCKS